MTHENITNPLFIAALFTFLVFASWAIATAISALMDRADRKKLEQMEVDFAIRIAADKKKHADFMANIEAITKESDAKLLAMKNCPKWKKLKQEINSEHAAMVKGRNQFNAMMGR